MCLPFICGGGHKGDDGSQHDPSVQQPQQAPLQPWAAAGWHEEGNVQPYNKLSSPVKEVYGHHGTTNVPAAAGGEGKNGGARAAQGHMTEVNKNGGGPMTDFGYSDGNVHASVGGVVRGRESQSAAGKIVASTTPATQAFNNKHRDLAAAQQAPQRTYLVSASPRHHHGHGSHSIASQRGR